MPSHYSIRDSLTGTLLKMDKNGPKNNDTGNAWLNTFYYSYTNISPTIIDAIPTPEQAN